MGFAEFLYTTVLKPPFLRRLTNRILLAAIPRVKRVGPATLYLDPDDPVLSGALALHVYERGEMRFFLEHCRGDITFVDVGANIGLYTALAMHRMGKLGRVVAIEPRKESFALLERNISLNRSAASPRVDALRVAAAAEIGELVLYQNPDNKADNRVYWSNDFHWQATNVSARPLDDLLSEQGVTELHVLKMDVQGFEQMVLRGARKTLERSPRVLLLTEFWPKGLSEAGGGAHSYLQELVDLGFAVYVLDRKGLLPIVDRDALILTLGGRKYANLVGVKSFFELSGHGHA